MAPSYPNPPGTRTAGYRSATCRFGTGHRPSLMRGIELEFSMYLLPFEDHLTSQDECLGYQKLTPNAAVVPAEIFVTQDPETHTELPPHERGRIRSDPKPDPRHFVTVDLADDTDRAIGGWSRHHVELFQRRFVKDLEEAGIRAMLRNDLDDKDNLDSILKRQGWTPEPDISTEYQAWCVARSHSPFPFPALLVLTEAHIRSQVACFGRHGEPSEVPLTLRPQ